MITMAISARGTMLTPRSSAGNVVEFGDIDEQSRRPRPKGARLTPHFDTDADAGGAQGNGDEKARDQIEVEQVTRRREADGRTQSDVADPNSQRTTKLAQQRRLVDLETDPEQNADDADSREQLESRHGVGIEQVPGCVGQGGGDSQQQVTD